MGKSLGRTNFPFTEEVAICIFNRTRNPLCRHPILYLPKSEIPGLDDDTTLSIIIQIQIVSPIRRFEKGPKLKPKPKSLTLTKQAYTSFKRITHPSWMHTPPRHASFKPACLKVVYASFKATYATLRHIPQIARFFI